MDTQRAEKEQAHSEEQGKEQCYHRIAIHNWPLISRAALIFEEIVSSLFGMWKGPDPLVLLQSITVHKLDPQASKPSSQKSSLWLIISERGPSCTSGATLVSESNRCFRELCYEAKESKTFACPTKHSAETAALWLHWPKAKQRSFWAPVYLICPNEHWCARSQGHWRC